MKTDIKSVAKPMKTDIKSVAKPLLKRTKREIKTPKKYDQFLNHFKGFYYFLNLFNIFVIKLKYYLYSNQWIVICNEIM